MKQNVLGTLSIIENTDSLTVESPRTATANNRQESRYRIVELISYGKSVTEAPTYSLNTIDVVTVDSFPQKDGTVLLIAKAHIASMTAAQFVLKKEIPAGDDVSSAKMDMAEELKERMEKQKGREQKPVDERMSERQIMAA